MSKFTKVEIDYTLQDNGRIRVHKIRGFPTVYPNECPEEYGKPRFFIFREALYRGVKGFHDPPSIILRENRSYKRKYFDKIRNLLIQDICDETPVEKKKKIQVKKKEMPITVPDTEILVKVKNAASKQNFYTVTAVKALTYEELPEIYTKSYKEYILPIIWQHKDALIADGGNTLLLQVGRNYNYGRLKMALCYIELAGRHLAQAKAHFKERTRPDWTKHDNIIFKNGKLQRNILTPKSLFHRAIFGLGTMRPGI